MAGAGPPRRLCRPTGRENPPTEPPPQLRRTLDRYSLRGKLLIDDERGPNFALLPSLIVVHLEHWHATAVWQVNGVALVHVRHRVGDDAESEPAVSTSRKRKPLTIWTAC